MFYFWIKKKSMKNLKDQRVINQKEQVNLKVKKMIQEYLFLKKLIWQR